MKRRIDFTKLPSTKACLIRDLLVGVDAGLHVVDHVIFHSSNFNPVDCRVEEHVLANKAMIQTSCPFELDMLANVIPAFLHVGQRPSHLEVVDIYHKQTIPLLVVPQGIVRLIDELKATFV